MSDVDDDVAQLRMGMERLQNKLLNPKPKASARSKATKSETPKSRPAGKTSSTAGKAIRSTKAKTISASGRKLPLGGGAALPASVGRRKKATKKADPFNDASKSQNSFASRVQTAEKHRGLVSQLETVTRDLKLLSSGMDHSEAIEDSRECDDEVISASPPCMDYGSLRVFPNVPKSVHSDEQAGNGNDFPCIQLILTNVSLVMLDAITVQFQAIPGIDAAELDSFLRGRRKESSSWVKAGQRLLEDDSDDDEDSFEDDIHHLLYSPIEDLHFQDEVCLPLRQSICAAGPRHYTMNEWL